MDSPTSNNRQGRLGLAVSSIRTAWNQAQTRLGAMVLTDVPIVLLVAAIVLALFGVMMVLSASSVEQISAGAVPYGQARTQAGFALAGFALMLFIGYVVPVRIYRHPLVLTIALLVSILLLTAVVFVGNVVNGNRNWLSVGNFSMQPSEFVKPVMILWLASVYSRQGRIDRGTIGQTLYKALFPAVLGFGLVIALILAGHDAGTVLIYILFFGAIFMAARPSWSTVNIGLAVAVTGALALVVSSPNRLERIVNTFAFWRECQVSTCDQANSGLAALATGGFWGVGLGQSRQKYNYLPEAHNDYIFAVVGEELGLVGAVAVILLYAALIYCSMRILLRSSDLFIRFATIGIMTWIAGQALLNISMVVGLMPVIGVPLPFISAGGSALVSSLIGVGLLIAFARQTPLNPIVGERVGLVNTKTQKDAARRVALARIVAREQIALASDPYGAGWTLEKFKTRWDVLFKGSSKLHQPTLPEKKRVRSAPPGGSRPARPAPQAKRKPPVKSVSGASPVATRRPSTAGEATSSGAQRAPKKQVQSATKKKATATVSSSGAQRSPKKQVQSATKKNVGATASSSGAQRAPKKQVQSATKKKATATASSSSAQRAPKKQTQSATKKSASATPRRAPQTSRTSAKAQNTKPPVKKKTASGSKPTDQSVAQKEQKLPQGLRTIHKARNLPENPK